MTGPTPLVRADGLTLITKRRPVWSSLSFEFGTGLSVVSGRTGSGRSSLLLALVGRMSGVSGRLDVAGLDAIGRARRLRSLTSVARLSTMIDLEPQLTVAESITERALTDRVPTEPAHLRMRSLEGRVEREFDRTTLVGELDAYDRTLLAACLAELAPARLAVLDDIDAGLSQTEQRRAMLVLARLPDPDSGIVVSTREPAAAPRDSALLRLPEPSSRTEPSSLPTPDRIEA